MTTYDNQTTVTIHFEDQANGTDGADQLTLDPSSTSTHPSGGTALNGMDGNDKITIQGSVQTGWESVSVDGGSGTDALFISTTAISDGLSIDASTGTFSIGAVSAVNIEALNLTLGAGNDTVTGGIGNDNITGGNGANTLKGYLGNDTIGGGDNHDELYGGDGNDHLLGGGGDDLLYGGAGLDNIDGGAGVDKVDFTALGFALNHSVGVTLDAGTYKFDNDDRGLLSNVENVDGTALNDEIIGDVNANIIHGLGGNDKLVGANGETNDGADTLYGDEDNDQLYGQAGNDKLYGGDGDDTIDGGAGLDTMDGGAGKDTLDYTLNASVSLKADLTTGDVYIKSGGTFQLSTETATNFEIVKGGTADEVFIVGKDEQAYGGDGDDELHATGNGGLLYGGKGTDTLYADGKSDGYIATGFDGDDVFYGGKGDGVFSGGGGDDVAHGGSGDEFLLGGGAEGIAGSQADGADTLSGNGGNDYIVGYADSDTLDGGTGDDVVVGGDKLDPDVLAKIKAQQAIPPDFYQYQIDNTDTAANTLTGGDDNDYVIGANGADSLTGGDGNDNMYGGGGADTIYGGDGDDLIDAGDGDDKIYGGKGKDDIMGGLGDDLVVVNFVADGASYVGGIGTGAPEAKNTLDLSAITGAIIISGSGKFTVGGAHAGESDFAKIILTNNADYVTGNSNDETFVGNGGNDTFKSGGGNDTYDGGDGNDTVSFANAPVGVTVSLATSKSQDTGAGNDTLKSIETLIGSTNDDTLSGNGHANTLAGGAGDDTLDGGGGGDTFRGGAGGDTIVAGTGVDTFVYSKASESDGNDHDIVENANLGADLWDVPTHVVGIDAAITKGELQSATFDHLIATAADHKHLDARNAVIFMPNKGDLAGHTYLIVDLNGKAGFQAGADLVIELTGATNVSALSFHNFI